MNRREKNHVSHLLNNLLKVRRRAVSQTGGIILLCVLVFSLVFPVHLGALSPVVAGARESGLRGSTVSEPGVDWEWRNPLPQGSALRDVVYNQDLYVAVGDAGAIVTSPDGVEWTNYDSGEGLSSVTWGNNQFVAVGSGVILTSPDGVAWAKRDLGINALLNCVTWSGSQFVAVGNDWDEWGGIIVTSLDGVVWTKLGSTDQYLNSVIWSGSQLVAVGESGAILTSPDGAVWTERNSETHSSLYGSIWSGSQFVVVGNGVILTSPDGVIWNEPDSELYDLTSVAWGNNQFVAVGHYGTIITSPDGVTWLELDSDIWSSLSGVTWGGNQYIAVGEHGAILTSSDGQLWTKRTLGTQYSFGDISWGGNQFVAVGGEEFWDERVGTIHTSPDGVVWTKRDSGTAASLSSVTWSGSQFVVVGGERYWDEGAGTIQVVGTILTSPDGVVWTKQDSGTAASLSSVTWSGSQFVAVGGEGNWDELVGTIHTSPDGVVWTKQDSGISGQLSSVTWGGNQFVAVGGYWDGEGVGTIYTSPDGVVWAKQDSGTAAWLRSVTWSGSQFVTVGDSDWDEEGVGTIYTSPDGAAWTQQVSCSCMNLFSVTWGGSQFVAVGSYIGYGMGSDVGVILTSPDGEVWTARNSKGCPELSGVAWDGSQFIAVGEYGTILGSGTPVSLEQYKITIAIEGQGTTDPAPGVHSYQNGTQVTLTATPADGYDFVSWVENGTEVSTNSTYAFSADRDRTLTAKFTDVADQLQDYFESNYPNSDIVGSFSDVIDQGQTSAPVSYTAPDGKDLVFILGWAGSELKLSVYDPDNNLYEEVQGNVSPLVIEAKGAAAGDWSYTVTGVDVPQEDYPYEVLIGQEASASASYEVTVTANPEAGGTVAGGGFFAHGAEITVSASPEAGYFFIGWTEESQGVSITEEYTLTVSGNHNLVAHFHRYGDVSGDGQVDVGDAILLLRHIVGLIDIEEDYGPYAYTRARVSGVEGGVDVGDAILILRYIVGLITEFPAEG
jgi:hypothetical protein